jgi:hypothetical protein
MSRGTARVLAVGALGLAGLSCAAPLRERIEDLVEGYDTILSEGIFVSVDTGNDRQPGTRSLPKQTIQGALQILDKLGVAGKVQVAEGRYLLEETLVVPSGMRFSGGYSAADWSRQPALHPSILESAGADPVVGFAEGATANTVLEDFTIVAAWTDSVTAVYCRDSSPTIRHNNIDASLGIQDSIGIFNSSASPILDGNIINAGKGTESCWGIANTYSSPQIRNNIIYHTGGGGAFLGIINMNSSAAVIQNNTIHIGNRSDDVAIYSSSSRCVIENNILYSEPEEGIGIREADSGALPLRVHCNDIYGCQAVYDARGVLKTSIIDMEAYLLASSVPRSGNGSVDPGFIVDPMPHNYHLAGASPLAGLDLSAAFTTDLEDAPRTVPWSVGAYEKD